MKKYFYKIFINFNNNTEDIEFINLDILKYIELKKISKVSEFVTDYQKHYIIEIETDDNLDIDEFILNLNNKLYVDYSVYKTIDYGISIFKVPYYLKDDYIGFELNGYDPHVSYDYREKMKTIIFESAKCDNPYDYLYKEPLFERIYINLDNRIIHILYYIDRINNKYYILLSNYNEDVVINKKPLQYDPGDIVEICGDKLLIYIKNENPFYIIGSNPNISFDDFIFYYDYKIGYLFDPYYLDKNDISFYVKSSKYCDGYDSWRLYSDDMILLEKGSGEYINPDPTRKFN